MTSFIFDLLSTSTIFLSAGIDLLLSLDARFVVGMKASVEGHQVERVLLHEHNELRDVVRFGNRIVDLLHHLALGIDVNSLRDVHLKNGPRGFRTKPPILTT